MIPQSQKKTHLRSPTENLLKKSGGVVPYTGDSNATGIAITLASAAVVLIGGGIYLRRRGLRE